MDRRYAAVVAPWEVIETANEIYHQIYGNLRSLGDLTYGWYQRFSSRHPKLCLRASEPLSAARNAVNYDGLRRLFYSIAKDVIVHSLDASRVFNVDETSL